MKLFVAILPCFILLLAICSSVAKSKIMANTGREFRNLYPELRRIGKKQATTYLRRSRSPVWIPGVRVYAPRNRYLRRRFVPRAIMRNLRVGPNSLVANRRRGRKSTLEEQLHNLGNFSLGFARNLGSNRRNRFNKNPPRFRVTGISRQRQSMINKCKSIKAGKCCKGWLKHSLTGYCTPSCSKSCVHGTCQNERVCKCSSGFAGPLCNIDTNECAKDICEHGCLNTYGSYRCVCDVGYAVKKGGSCIKIDPCKLKKCQYKCYLDGEDAKCVCPKGYRVGEDGARCEDVDECTVRDIKCHTKDEFRSCKNLPGSYVCACREGYFYHRYFKQCYDSNECLLEKHNCNMTVSRCVNTEGGYRCVCRDGYTGDGFVCFPVNETKGLKCDLNGQVIVSKTGKKECRCREGFVGNGLNCKLSANADN